MKKILFLLLDVIISIALFAQNDTASIYYTRRMTECDRDTAVYYAKIYKNGDNWTKKIFTIKNDLLITEGTYTDKSCQTQQGVFNLYKDGMLSSSSQYLNGKLLNRTTFYENGKKRSFLDNEGERKIKNWDENGNEIEVPAFFRVEKEARFPGGPGSWQRYLEKNLDASVASRARAPVGNYTVKVQFIVDKEGIISNVQATEVPARCGACAREAVRVIRDGPRWEPAVQDGRPVIYQALQYITFQVAQE